jgi:Big-like domain-containing protein
MAPAQLHQWRFPTIREVLIRRPTRTIRGFAERVIVLDQKEFMLTLAKRSYAAVLPLIFSLAWMPLEAFAQLPLPCVPGLTCPSRDTTPPTVRITSPASGATVSGTITARADASDNVGVAGVQFQYNGINFDREDTSPPYTATVYTNNVPDGTYTLTAVARDAAGNRTTSDPVTITIANNASASRAAATRYEETDPSVSFSGGWMQDTLGFGWSGGNAMESMTPGTQAAFSFSGTSVTWIGMRGPDSGIARVFVDGVLVSELDMYARSYEVHVPVFAASGLANSSHTLTIEVTGLKDRDQQAAMSPYALVVVDAFDVPSQVFSRLQDTDPDLTYTAGWTARDDSKSWSGWFASISTVPGAQATLAFNGTSISWIGYRGPDAGIARVFLDGSFAGEVDLYQPQPSIQAIVFTSPFLADADHTLMIEATGRKNPASSDARVLVDAFDVAKLGTRFEETDRSVAYTGAWTHEFNLNRAWSMGSVAGSDVPGAQATFTFTGTSVSWIGCRKYTTGIANVYLDGVFVAEIDTFASPQEGYQNTIFTAAGLAGGSHTLTIEATGRKNPAASSAYVGVDAFDVRP